MPPTYTVETTVTLDAHDKPVYSCLARDPAGNEVAFGEGATLALAGNSLGEALTEWATDRRADAARNAQL